MLLNEKLKMLRKEKELTQEELAEKLNVSRQAITKWESGEGIPDINNLKQISIMFNITIDELIKEEKEIQIDNENSFVEEFEIDHTKHFDIEINSTEEIELISNTDEKVKIEALSIEERINELIKIKIDNHYNRLDIKINNKLKKSKIKIYIPEKYIDEIELKSKIRSLNINSIDIVKLEFDGSIKYLNVNNSKGNIILNASKCDIEANYDKFDGRLEINTINSTARVKLPKDTEYKTMVKGIKNKFIDANDKEDAQNIIELNGINSKIIMIED